MKNFIDLLHHWQPKEKKKKKKNIGKQIEENHSYHINIKPFLTSALIHHETA